MEILRGDWAYRARGLVAFYRTDPVTLAVHIAELRTGRVNPPASIRVPYRVLRACGAPGDDCGGPYEWHPLLYLIHPIDRGATDLTFLPVVASALEELWNVI